VQLSRFEDGEVDVAEPMVVMPNQRQIDGHALLHGGIGKSLSDTVAVRLIGELFPNLREVGLTIRIWEVRERCRPLAHEMHAPPEQVARGAPLGRIDVGLREHTTAEYCGNLVRVDLVVFGLTAMDGLPVERMAEHTSDPFLGAEVRQPIPGEHTLNGNGEIVPLGRNDLEQRLRAGVEMAVDHDFTIAVHDADIHRSRMQVDAAVMVMLFGVESPEVSSSS
jgi:hypothetical protein